jgi:fatty acid desaturase
MVWLFVAALSLNFGVHITYHEFVHLSGNKDTLLIRALSFWVTLFCGIPFDGYRWHHYTHHRFNNGLEDYSTTWKISAEGKLVSRNWFGYSVGWPVQLLKGRADLIKQLRNSSAPVWIQQRIQREKVFLAAVYLLVFIFNWRLGLLYLALTYLGWALVTLHNYGQHLPVKSEGAYATSFQSRWYNLLFCNNGIHFEHHAEPGVIWYQLKPRADAPCPVGLPHLAGPLFVLTERTNS